MDHDRAAPRRRPTRSAIVALLEASPDGMTAAEIGGALGLEPNGVRKQLRNLIGAGAVGAEREVTGRRGRPAVRYRPAAPERQAVAARRLARMLTELVAELAPDERVVEEFGRRQAAALSAEEDGRSALMGLLTTMGFAPREGGTAGDPEALDVVLGRCPFEDAVTAEGGRLVCALHRGLSRGLVERTPGGRLTGFEIRAPQTGGCRILARGLPRPAAPQGERRR